MIVHLKLHKKQALSLSGEQNCHVGDFAPPKIKRDLFTRYALKCCLSEVKYSQKYQRSHAKLILGVHLLIALNDEQMAFLGGETAVFYLQLSTKRDSRVRINESPTFQIGPGLFRIRQSFEVQS